MKNKEIFTDEKFDPVSLTTKFHNIVRDYNAYATKFLIPRDHLLRFSFWSLPLDSWVNINFDIHVSSRTDRGLGMVFRDNSNKLLLVGIRRVKALWSLEISEAAAVLFGLEIAIRFGYCLVHLEGDSMNVVRAIDKRAFDLSPIHLLYDCIFFRMSLG